MLTNQLVLKGGTALYLVHGIGTRGSLDVDLSLEEDFSNVREAEERLIRSLTETFAAVGYTVFDAVFAVRPSSGPSLGDRRWGGYELRFKLTTEASFSSQLERVRREAIVVGSDSLRTFRIQISRFEFCGTPTEVRLDDQAVVVYSPALIAIEKLRAICQQLPSYARRAHPAPRARDFYDIYQIRKQAHVHLSSPSNLELIRQSFAAKDVGLELIAEIATAREFHRVDWASVENAVADRALQDFDFYFDELVRDTNSLKVLWVEEPP